MSVFICVSNQILSLRWEHKDLLHFKISQVLFKQLKVVRFDLTAVEQLWLNLGVILGRNVKRNKIKMASGKLLHFV